MGSYGTSSGGKYEGFGNSPINRSSVTDKVRDLLESVMSLPDPKKQIMQLCLEVIIYLFIFGCLYQERWLIAICLSDQSQAKNYIINNISKEKVNLHLVIHEDINQF